VILCDTGPLVSLLDPNQGESHNSCRAFFDGLRDTLVTTWPCITEAMYLMHKIGGWPLQGMLWQLLATEVFSIYPTDAASAPRIEVLMERYRNVPMDMADASLFVAAERLGIRKIFTLDGDFRIYRFEDGGVFEVYPQD
jgi:predicted nucleic acid-binding protein